MAITERDALGFTPEQRAEQEFSASAVAERLQEWVDGWTRAEKVLASAPAGTLIACHLPGCGPHSLEMYR